MDPTPAIVTLRPAWWTGSPVGAAEVDAYLRAVPALAGIGGVSVQQNGAISVELPDPALAAPLVAALEAFDPAEDGVPREERTAKGLVRDARQALAAVEALTADTPAAQRQATLKQAAEADLRLTLAVTERLWRVVAAG